MLTPWEIDRKIEEKARVLKAQAQPPTPGHSAAAAANEFASDNADVAEAERRRRCVQHEVDPYLHAGELPRWRAGLAELGKRLSQAFDTSGGIPADGPVAVRRQFRRGSPAGSHARRDL